VIGRPSELIAAAKAAKRTARTPYVCPAPPEVSPPLDISVVLTDREIRGCPVS
jgi:hypothetical protein